MGVPRWAMAPARQKQASSHMPPGPDEGAGRTRSGWA